MLTKKVKYLPGAYQTRMSPGKVPFKDDNRPSSKIQDGKRRQLESILGAEKAKEERGKLGCVLIDRLIKKFGSKHSGLITFFVEEFMLSHSSITKDDIASLEKEVGQALDSKSTSSNGSRPNTSLPNLNATSAEMVANGQINNANGSITSRNEAQRPPSGAEWQLINSYQLLMGEEKEKMERENLRNKKLNFKKSLDDHIQEARTIQSGINNDKDYAKNIAIDIEKFHNEEKMKFAARVKRNQDISELRMQQIAEKQRRLAKEKEDSVLAELRSQEINQIMQKKETERSIQLKLEKLQNQERIKAENAENDRIKEQQRLKSAEEDQRLMQEYAAKLDREAIARENAFKTRMEQSERVGTRFQNEGPGKVIMEEKLRAELLLIKEQQRKEEIDRMNDLKKEEDRRKRTQLQLVENERQIEKKRLEAEEQRRQDQLVAEAARRAAEEYRIAEEEKYRRYKAKQGEYRELLNNQMEEIKVTTVKLKGISPVEKEINMPTIREATQDPLVLSRVMHRMRITGKSTGGATGGSFSGSLPKTSRAPF